MQKKILIVAATVFEIEILMQKKLPLVDYCLTGVGMVNTALALTQVLSQKESADYDWVLNMGVAGVYAHAFDLGTVVEIHTDQYGDIGAEEANGNFLDMQELGLMDSLWYKNKNRFSDLPPAHGLTVNRVHGAVESIKNIQQKYPNIQTESMEGAAFFQTCEQLKVKQYAQIRAISNHVEPRNRANWQMKTAIHNLNETIAQRLTT